MESTWKSDNQLMQLIAWQGVRKAWEHNPCNWYIVHQWNTIHDYHIKGNTLGTTEMIKNEKATIIMSS